MWTEVTKCVKQVQVSVERHIKKMVQKYFFALCDFMILNSFLARNLAAKEYRSEKRNTKKCDYYAALAE